MFCLLSIFPVYILCLLLKPLISLVLTNDFSLKMHSVAILGDLKFF